MWEGWKESQGNPREWENTLQSKIKTIDRNVWVDKRADKIYESMSGIWQRKIGFIIFDQNWQTG